MAAQAAKAPTKFDAPVISNLKVYISADDDQTGLEFSLTVPDSIKNAIDYYANHERGYNQVGYVSGLWAEYSADGGEWKSIDITSGGDTAYDNTYGNGQRRTWTSGDISAEKQLRFRLRFFGWDENLGDWESPWSNVLTLNENLGNMSGWARPEVEKADALGLIPDALKGADLTKPITRAEFAAVSVRVYEALSGVAAIPAVNNPFTDTKDAEVLKAFNVGITTGTSATTFDPDALLNREQAATMLTSVFKKVSLAGWTIQTDNQFKLDYTMPALFADDSKISAYARDSVYFMVANGIIEGTGNNIFAPRATTSEDQAKGYAQATREQALAIAVRMVEKL
jgi:hypothetical protein